MIYKRHTHSQIIFVSFQMPVGITFLIFYAIILFLATYLLLSEKINVIIFGLLSVSPIILPLVFSLSQLDFNNSSKSQVIKDLKATMNDPKSFELVEFKTLYDDDTYALHYIRFSGTNAFGGTVTDSITMYYYQDNNCASETVGSDFLSYFSGLSDSYYISTIENRPMCRPQAWE